MGLSTSTAAGELLQYYCSPVCGSPTQQVWDLLLLYLYSSFHLVVASSLSLDVGYLFWGGQHPPVNGCSTASCHFCALTGDDIILSAHKFLDLLLDQGLANIFYKESHSKCFMLCWPYGLSHKDSTLLLRGKCSYEQHRS